MTQLFGESEDAAKIVTLNLFAAAKYVPPFKGASERAKHNMETLLEDFVGPMIKEHKIKFNPDNLNDYIDAFLHEQEYGEAKQDFNDEQLQNCALQLAAAASDTASATMSWDILCYLHYPEYQDLLHGEVDAILGKDKNPTMSVRDRMPLTCAFLHETARYRSPVNIMYREAIEPVSAMGYTIPTGTTVLVNLWGIHKDPQAWDNPEKFDPKRHINEEGNFVPSSNIIPFCAGYRRCIGENLARTEEFIIFTKLLQNFRFESATEKLPDINNGHNNLVHCPIPYKVNLIPR